MRGERNPAGHASRSDDQRERQFPVTGEVGGEGGSFADPTLQVPTFHDDVPRTQEPAAEPPLTPGAESVPRMRRDPSE